MKNILVTFGLVIFVVALGQAYGNSGELYFEELQKLLEHFSCPDLEDYSLPLFDYRGRMVGQVMGCHWNENVYEFVVIGDRILGIGMGNYLHALVEEAKSLACQTLTRRFGNGVRVVEVRLVYSNPLLFFIQVFYDHGGMMFNDLYLRFDSLRFTLDGCKENMLPEQSDAGLVSLEKKVWFEISYEFPYWEYYLSSFSNVVVTLADYWKFKSWIKMPIYPEEPDLMLLNAHLMMQDVDMLRRKCKCENSESGTASIVEQFINARGGNVKVFPQRFSFSTANMEEVIQFLTSSLDQPLLLEIEGVCYNFYGILLGYFTHSRGFFLNCIVPTKVIQGTRWERYFLNAAVPRSWVVYQIVEKHGE